MQTKEYTFSHVIKKIITSIKSKPGEPIKVNIIAGEENCEKRRLYDLFNVLCSLGLCNKSIGKMYMWVGEENMLRTIQFEYEKFETEAIQNEFWEFFKLPESPPIGQLTMMILVIFLFFGVHEMSLKQICLVLAQKRSKMTVLLRRLYLAAFFLEQLGLISHSLKIGSYQLNLDADTIVKATFDDMKKRMLFPINSIEMQLQRIDNSFIAELKSMRYMILLQKMRLEKIPVTSAMDEEQESPNIENIVPQNHVSIY
ncbi:hypothetical protein TVAG_554920 [Trichomonas vaginalis G3]|uniref:E2F/DP family winged-helix DNA-binding domain-containing protein n=1 Tax=Trichomonas vaginalis (strain ATCC PRA-98 / G3) TaxID=412133 RepID=A2GN27_TRIV3|nr:e2F-like (mammalian transcription factor) family [Trichomonas vaginalis G3]EAX81440.1 hypothetical protein TVAG_554920 [Trichomonas vaginalis G3]KAI5509310.1 e2F-like (mammalian transcription factor) family [Trichomonas vaginalis G3]|eukprot:XP_001294370.1 hypothetical protein [Trichomonas vaginalis G3]